MPVVITGLNQVPPIDSGGAKLSVSFQISGDPPSFVQIYAAPAGGGVGSASLLATVMMESGTSQYDVSIDVAAGVYYAVYVCPRMGSTSQPDDTTDGAYWESCCAVAYIATKTQSAPAQALDPPVITALIPYPANLHQGNRMTVMWSSSTSYDKYVLGWVEDGYQTEPQQIDYTKLGDPWSPEVTNIQSQDISEKGTSGNWQVPTRPGYLYFFRVNGGISQFWNYNYSAWGPTAALVACPNSTSVRLFLSDSGLNPAGQGIRSLVAPGQSVRSLLQI